MIVQVLFMTEWKQALIFYRSTLNIVIESFPNQGESNIGNYFVFLRIIACLIFMNLRIISSYLMQTLRTLETLQQLKMKRQMLRKQILKTLQQLKMIAPLVFVVGLSMAKEAMEDWRRFMQDMKVSLRKASLHKQDGT